MKAVGYKTPGPIDREDALIDFVADKPEPGPHDLLVKIRAISVNPVDFVIRKTREAEGDTPAILGWDAVGEVVAVGGEVSLFKVGDDAFYAGAINRPGANCEFHLVDERIAGHKPTSLTDPEAAALPLTTLTAHEMLFSRLRVTESVPGAVKACVIIGGSGGVGSIAIQLLRAKTDVTVIATASREETKTWVRELGAHHVIDHSKPLAPQIEALELGGQPAFVFSTTHSASYIPQVAEFIAPQGRFGLIDDPKDVDIGPFKFKSVSVHWEFMYTRSLYGTADMAEQRAILEELAGLVDSGKVRSTVTDSLGPITAANLIRAHKILESGKARGKMVLVGFE